jgi:signal transduction histidine kinase
LNLFKNISIRNKLVLIQVLTSVLVLGIFATVFILTQVHALKSRKANDVYSVAGVIAQNSIAPLQFQDNDAAEQMLKELESVEPEITYGAIFDANSRVFAAARGKDPDTAALRFFNHRPGTFFPDNKHLVVIRLVVSGKQVLGKVYLRVRLDEISLMESDMLELAVGLAMISLLAAFIISFALQPYISSRLLNLMRTMQRVGNTGDYAVALPQEGKDEIGVLYREFARLLQQIRENEQRKDEFIGIASHELKTPLTNVKGYLEILESMEEQPNLQLVERALINARKLEKLVADLLDVSRIQTGQLELRLTWFDVDALIRETIATTKMLAKDTPILYSGTNNLQIHADRQRLEQVLLNLLSNAVKYSGAGKTVTVDAAYTDKELRIEVADNGPGIAPGEETAIFDRFYRSKDVLPHISGFGLGLYICRDIIKRHGGHIWVVNRPDGASFFFLLPLNGAQSNGQPKE